MTLLCSTLFTEENIKLSKKNFYYLVMDKYSEDKIVDQGRHRFKGII